MSRSTQVTEGKTMKNFANSFFICMAVLAATYSCADELSEAENHYLNGDFESALKVFLPLATPAIITPNGDKIAQYYLGEMFYFGSGVEQNYSQALNWYSLSAEQGDPDSAYSIGHMHENGHGVEKSVQLAIEWYKRAEELGSDAATAAIGLIYVYDEGEYHALEAGLEILTAAADTGNVDAQFYLGSIYYSGEAVAPDLDLALIYLRMAEQQGDNEALNFITWILDDERYAKSYNEYVSDMRFSPDDEYAFKCENFLWSFAYGLALTANEEGDERLLEFSEDALGRINRFGENLDNEFRDRDYDTRQRYREISAWLNTIYEEFNIELRSTNRADLPLPEQLLLDRQIGGVFEIVFHPSFYEYLESLDDEQLYSMWDDCIERHLPNRMFSADISLSALNQAFGLDTDQPSLLGRITNWSRNSLRRISELNACEGDYDFAGGAAVGTLATSVVAGDSVVMLIGSTGLLVATAPAVATGVTITALAGSAVYLTAKGYCFVTR